MDETSPSNIFSKYIVKGLHSVDDFRNSEGYNICLRFLMNTNNSLKEYDPNNQIESSSNVILSSLTVLQKLIDLVHDYPRESGSQRQGNSSYTKWLSTVHKVCDYFNIILLFFHISVKY